MIDNRYTEGFHKNDNSEFKRSNIINYLIKKNSFKKYLEIGIFNGFTFKKVACELKHGVEPGAEGVCISEVTHRMTSDDFFKICKDTYDIILIDGLHEYRQVIKDFNNSIKHINHNGYILFHDCNPPDELSQKVPRESISWNGDVWKAFVMIRESNPHSFVFDTDFGIGVVKNNTDLNPVDNTSINIGWKEFDSDRQNLLGLIDLKTLDQIT